MTSDKIEIMDWSEEEKRNLAFEKSDSIGKELTRHELPAWKKELIQQRIAKDKTEDGEDVIAWETLRDEYKR